MNTSKSLDEIIFSQEYPIKNKHLKDCAFVWLDEGNCNCEQNIPKARAAIVEAVEGLIIGEDEPEVEFGCNHNYLRAKQRKAIKEWQ